MSLCLAFNLASMAHIHNLFSDWSPSLLLSLCNQVREEGLPYFFMHVLLLHFAREREWQIFIYERNWKKLRERRGEKKNMDGNTRQACAVLNHYLKAFKQQYLVKLHCHYCYQLYELLPLLVLSLFKLGSRSARNESRKINSQTSSMIWMWIRIKCSLVIVSRSVREKNSLFFVLPIPESRDKQFLSNWDTLSYNHFSWADYPPPSSC